MPIWKEREDSEAKINKLEMNTNLNIIINKALRDMNREFSKIWENGEFHKKDTV